jgi:hypothetical protein
MLIGTDDKLLEGIQEYCKINGLEIEKVVQESVIQYQLRHCIDEKGKTYSKEISKIRNIKIKRSNIKDLELETKEISCELFGDVLERIEGIYQYIISEYRNMKMIFIIKNKNMIDELKNKNELSIERIENNQAYCWITNFYTEVMVLEIGNNKDFLICL